MGDLKCSKQCCTSWLRANILLLLTLAGVVVGFILAILLKNVDPSDDAIMWINLPGELFMRALKCAILPIIVSSVITAVASLDIKTNSKLGAIAFAFMVIAIVTAVLLGVVLTLAIKPGKAFNQEVVERELSYYETQDVFIDLFRNLITDNIVKACLQTAFTTYELNTTSLFDNTTNKTTEDVEVLSKELAYGGGTNYLGVLLFSMVFGMAMSVEREHTGVMLDFFMAMRVIVFKIITVLLWVLPVASISLIAGSILSVDSIIDVFISLGLFAAVVIVGLGIHTFLTVPVIYLAFTRKNPYKPVMLGALRPGLFVTIVRSSIASTVEVLNACERIGMNPKVYDFVVPLSINFKKDGSAVFITCSCLWLAQTDGVALTAGNVVSISILAAALAMCLPGIPSSSLVAIATIASSVGIPLNNIGILFAMEWLLDALRGGTNGVSYVVNTGVVDTLMGDKLEEGTTKPLNVNVNVDDDADCDDIPLKVADDQDTKF
ncbi:excitatory amino acid transporter-like [Glandiceps talaboti]